MSVRVSFFFSSSSEPFTKLDVSTVSSQSTAPGGSYPNSTEPRAFFDCAVQPVPHSCCVSRCMEPPKATGNFKGCL